MKIYKNLSEIKKNILEKVNLINIMKYTIKKIPYDLNVCILRS